MAINAIVAKAATTLAKGTAKAAKATAKNTAKVVKATAETVKKTGQAAIKAPGKAVKAYGSYKYSPKRLKYKSSLWDYKRRTAIPREIGKTIRSVSRDAASAKISTSNHVKDMMTALTQEVQRGQGVQNNNSDTAQKSTAVENRIGDDK